MSRLEKIKQRAAQFAERRTESDGGIDQGEARVERARQEARKEAKRERVQQRAEKAREEERERVLNDGRGGGIVSSVVSTIEQASDAVDDGDNERLDDISRAMGTDFDGDGEPFAQEIGLQSAARADAENQALSGLGQQVDRNTGRIGELEDVGVPDPGFGSANPAGVDSGNGNDGFGVSDEEVFGATDEEIFGSSAEEMFGTTDEDMFGGRGGGL